MVKFNTLGAAAPSTSAACDAYDYAQGVLDDLGRLQMAYGAVHQLALAAADGGNAIECRDQAEAILGLANDRLADVVRSLEDCPARVLAAHRAECPCPGCGRMVEQAMPRPKETAPH